MLFLKMMFWLLFVFLVFCFMSCVANATTGERDGARTIDILVGVVIFALFTIMLKYFGGYVL